MVFFLNNANLLNRCFKLRTVIMTRYYCTRLLISIFFITISAFYILFLLLDLKPCTFLTQMYIPLKNMNFKKIYISIVYIRASLTRYLQMIFTDKSLTSNDNHKTTMQWHRGNSKLATYICTFLLKINILARRCRQYKWLSWQPGWIPFMLKTTPCHNQEVA